MLQFFSASTSIVDSKRAVAECLENALAGENSLDCDLLIIHTGIGHNFKDLLSEARRLSPSAQIVGCTCAGVIGKEGPNESLKALAIMAVKGPKSEFAITGCESVLYPFEAGRQLALDLKNKNPDINLLFFNPSTHTALITTMQDEIDGIESVFGPDVPIIGGAAIDNMKLITSFEFLEDKIFEMGAVLTGIADPTLELIAHANHGCEVIGDPFIVTRSYATLIYELDGKPAWKAWTERLGMPVTSPPNDILVLAPLAMELTPDLQAEYGSRYIINGAMPLKDGSIQCTHKSEPGTKLWLTRRSEPRIHDGVERLMVKILDRCEGRRPVAVFHSDCAARGKLLFNRIMKEEIISQLQFPLCRGESIPWLGMYGGAEYTPMLGRNVLHQYTTSLYVLVRKNPVIVKEEAVLETDLVEKSKLFKKTSIGNINLKSRFIASATWQGRANFDGSTSPLLISSLLPVARGEVGMIIGEMAYVTASSASSPGQLGIYDDKLIPGLKRMADFIHDAGTPIILQLVHSGLCSSPMLGGIQTGPSVMETADGKMGKEMTVEEIAEVVTAFRDAATRAKTAGFDGVQIHAAHGWLLSQFLSPFFNKRVDSYGGNIENRSRLLIEITKRIKEISTPNFIVSVKINSDDYLPGGFSTDEMIRVCMMLEQEGVDSIEISGGTIGALLAGDPDHSFSPVRRKGVYYMDAARRYKEKIRVPLMLVGGIRSFEEADQIIETGVADYVSLCRPLIREPGLIKGWKSGNLKKSDCISESACFQPGVEGRGVQCVHLKIK